MSMQTDQIKQMYKVLAALTAVALEAHGTYSILTQNLEYQMSVLDEEMATVEITSDMVKELRSLTGDGMMSCLKALRHSKGNMEKAVDYINNRSGAIHI